MNPDQIAGPLRAVVPALVAYMVGRGWIPEGAAADIGTGLLALGAAGWSIYTNRRTAKVADVAAMPGTTVSADGKTIHVVEPELVTAAKEAATPASGKPAAV